MDQQTVDAIKAVPPSVVTAAQLSGLDVPYIVSCLTGIYVGMLIIQQLYRGYRVYRDRKKP